jgi:archaemetzincin
MSFRNCLLYGLLIFACGVNSSCGELSRNNRTVIIQPFGDFPESSARTVFEEIKKINPRTIIRPAIPLPAAAYYPARGRYRADSLISFLNRFGSDDSVVIGLTGRDISTTKNNKADWGVMGLAYRPGNACVVSYYRLSKENRSEQLFKIAVHELGHTQGLPHCAEGTCFMKDAEGGNPTDLLTGFCTDCKDFLKRKGWQL